MIYETIEAAYRYARPDADLLLHETVEAVLESADPDRVKLYRIRCAYASARAGQALRSANLREITEDVRHD